MKTGTVAERVFKVLKGNGFPVIAYDEEGRETSIPGDATRFFVKDPNLMVTVDENDIKVSKNSSVDFEQIESMTTMLKNLANESLRNYTIKNYGKSVHPRDFSYQTKEQGSKMRNPVSESRLSKLYGRTKTSYQTLGEVKLIYRHRSHVNEDSPVTRIRNIRSITLEHNGEKYSFPCNFVAGARAMARHLHEGGTWEDNVAQYIKEASQQYKKLSEFYRYANRNKKLVEGNEEAVRLVKESMDQIKYDFKKFTAPSTYSDYNEKFNESSLIPMDEENIDEIRDQFTIKSFNERFAEALPFVNGLLKEKRSFENSILEEIENGVYLRERPYFTNVIEFDDPADRLAYKLKETATVIENESLSNFIGRVSEKISCKQDLTEFEIDVIKEVLNKAKVNTVEDENMERNNYEDKVMETINQKLAKFTDLKECFGK